MNIEQRISVPDGVTIRKEFRVISQPETQTQIDKQVIDRTVNPDGSVTTVEICDGVLEIGPLKTCLNEFGTIQSVGIIAAVAFLIILWRKLK